MNNKKANLVGRDYNSIVNSMYKFRRFGINDKNSLMNIFDQPGQMFFKILFKFDADRRYANGLFGITNMDFANPGRQASFEGIMPSNRDVTDYRDSDGSVRDDLFPYLSNTAFHFLLMNGEQSRASMLMDFILLLSDINSNYPWYWYSISGIDALLERKIFLKEAKIEEEDPKISIKCMPDAYDNRIGTLIDLYRAICYDYINKRVIIPSNLRKFDMDIILVQSPTYGVHQIHSKSGTLLNDLLGDVKIMNKTMFDATPSTDILLDAPDKWTAADSAAKYTSYKILELKNCEFDFTSSKSGYGEMSNSEGFNQEYTIDIKVGDVYENRYNEFLGYNIGDFVQGVFIDSVSASLDSNENTSQYISNRAQRAIRSKLGLGGIDGQISDIIEDTAMSVVNKTKSMAKSYMLGNIHNFSLQQAKNIINDPAKVITTYASGAISGAIDSAISGSNRRNDPTSHVGEKLPGWPGNNKNASIQSDSVSTAETTSSSNNTKPKSNLGRLSGFPEPGSIPRLLNEVNEGRNLFNSL